MAMTNMQTILKKQHRLLNVESVLKGKTKSSILCVFEERYNNCGMVYQNCHTEKPQPLFGDRLYTI